MNEDWCIEIVTAHNMAFRLEPQVVRALIPREVTGAYLLLLNNDIVYVGRSDSCLQTRLASHPYLGYASHFLWAITKSVFQGYFLESYWFHRLQEASQGMNLIHPARPVGSTKSCPFCERNITTALKRVANSMILERTDK